MTAPTGPQFVAAGAVTASSGATTRTPVKPTESSAHGILVAVVSIKSNAVITTATPGWTKLYQDNSGATFTQAVFIARGDAANPVLSWSGSVACSAYVNFYDDVNNPIEVTTGATSVNSGTSAAPGTASLNSTRNNSVVVAITSIDVTTVPNTVGLYTDNTRTSNGTSVMGLYAGSRFLATSGDSTGAFSQTTPLSGNWVVRSIELLSVVQPAGLWAVETEFPAVAQISTGVRATEVEFPAVTQISTGVRAAEVEFPVVTQVGTGLRATEIEFVAVLLPGEEPPPPDPAPQISRVRTWWFSLDGHDFYVLRLGNQETLVFDITTGENVPWDSFERTVWRAHQGINWLGVGREFYTAGVPTNVIAGDDSFGTLWSLDPEYGLDASEDDGGEPTTFTRVITTGLPLRARMAVPCDAVFMTAANGEPFTGQEEITLRTSDDNGKTWQDQGAVTLTAGEYSQEIVWRSLGKMAAPGRIFEFTDTGATVRIDDIDIIVRGQDA